MGERILDRPGVLGFGTKEQALPLFVCKVGHETIQEFKLLDGALDNIFTIVSHERETSYFFCQMVAVECAGGGQEDSLQQPDLGDPVL
jgi:hypothetical protein